MYEEIFEAYCRNELDFDEEQELKELLRDKEIAYLFAEYVTERSLIKHASERFEDRETQEHIDPLVISIEEADAMCSMQRNSLERKFRIYLAAAIFLLAAVAVGAFLAAGLLTKELGSGSGEVVDTPNKPEPMQNVHRIAENNNPGSEDAAPNAPDPMPDLPVAAWVDGPVEVVVDDKVVKLEETDPIPAGSRVRTGEGGWARLQYPDATTLDVDANSELLVEASSDRNMRRLSLASGKMECNLKQRDKGKKTRLRTKHGTATMGKTRADISTDAASVALHVQEGVLDLLVPEKRNPFILANGEKAEVRKDKKGRHVSWEAAGKHVKRPKEPHTVAQFVDGFNNGKWDAVLNKGSISAIFTKSRSRSGDSSLRIEYERKKGKNNKARSRIRRSIVLPKGARTLNYWMYISKSAPQTKWEMRIREEDGDTWLCHKVIASKLRKARWIQLSANLPTTKHVKRRGNVRKGNGIFEPEKVVELSIDITGKQGKFLAYIDDFGVGQ